MADEKTNQAELPEEETEEQKKNKLIEWLKNHPKSVFWIRFGLWCLFAAILPFAFIAWRYGIFTKAPVIQLSGWGIIGIIILIVFVISLIRYLYQGLKPGLLKQCIKGFVSIILPLTILLLLVISIENSMNIFKQALGCVILCELIGIPLNPLPAWLEERNKEQEKDKAERMSDLFWDKFFKKKNEHKDD